MSRKISPPNTVSVPKEEIRLRKAETGRLIFTYYKERRCALFIQNNRLLAASFFPQKPSRIGAVYIGKIKNMASNIDACFVEIEGKEICFLPLEELEVPYLLNRSYNVGNPFQGKLLEGDEILVQVVRDAQKTKNATVTTRISLCNDYFVLSLGNKKVSFSSKLSSERRQAIEQLLAGKGIMKNGLLTQDPFKSLAASLGDNGLSCGCIVRTKAGECDNENKLLEQFASICSQFYQLLYTAKYRNCFSCLKQAPPDFEAIFQQLPSDTGLFEEGSLTKNNDSANENPPMWEIITDQEPLHKQLEKYCREHEINVKVRLYQDTLLSLSVLYAIDSKLETALSNRVWLKSGGYLIIEPTEALTVIDVNSGKFESKKDAQDTYRIINMEAAKEIALQLRLRNLSGIIIVDFINMKSSSDNKTLLNYLRTLVANDRIPTKIIDMTPLGLVEITRKKMNKPLREQYQQV